MCVHCDHQDLISNLIYSQWNGTEIILLPFSSLYRIVNLYMEFQIIPHLDILWGMTSNFGPVQMQASLLSYKFMCADTLYMHIPWSPPIRAGNFISNIQPHILGFILDILGQVNYKISTPDFKKEIDVVYLWCYVPSYSEL